jgi:hypothetical protein
LGVARDGPEIGRGRIEDLPKQRRERELAVAGKRQALDDAFFKLFAFAGGPHTRLARVGVSGGRQQGGAKNGGLAHGVGIYLTVIRSE